MRNRRRLFLLAALIAACLWLGFELGTAHAQLLSGSLEVTLVALVGSRVFQG